MAELKLDTQLEDFKLYALSPFMIMLLIVLAEACLLILEERRSHVWKGIYIDKF